jgi:hypothetical protein
MAVLEQQDGALDFESVLPTQATAVSGSHPQTVAQAGMPRVVAPRRLAADDTGHCRRLGVDDALKRHCRAKRSVASTTMARLRNCPRGCLGMPLHWRFELAMLTRT